MNALAKHTPGPWSWNRMPNRFRLLSATGAESGLAVRILVAEDEVWPDHPNAVLIAAAPELAEALLALVDTANAHCPVDHPALPLARNILRKAGLLS